jgi:hypothetical protein
VLTVVRSPRVAFSLVVLVALVLRVIFNLAYVGTSTIERAALPWTPMEDADASVIDGDGYIPLAERILSGLPYDDVTRQPLFPMFHAAVLAVFGRHPALLPNRLADALLMSLCCGFVYLISRRLFGDVAGFVAGLLAATNLNLIHKSGFIYSEDLAVPLLTAALYAFVVFSDTRRWGSLIVGSVLYGLATLARPATFAMLVVLPIWLWILYGRLGKAMLARTAAALGIVLVLIAPWAVHLTRRTGHLMFVSERPWRVLCGAYGPAQLEQPLGHDKGLWLREAECGLFTPEEIAEYKTMTIAEQEALCRKRFLAYLPQALRCLPQLMASRLLVFIGIDERRGLFLLYMVQQSALFALFLAGLWCSRAQWRRLSVLYVTYAFLGLLVVLVFYGGSRFRAVVDPIICVFAAPAIVELARRVGGKAGTRARASVAAAPEQPDHSSAAPASSDTDPTA